MAFVATGLGTWAYLSPRKGFVGTDCCFGTSLVYSEEYNNCRFGKSNLEKYCKQEKIIAADLKPLRKAPSSAQMSEGLINLEKMDSCEVLEEHP